MDEDIKQRYRSGRTNYALPLNPPRPPRAQPTPTHPVPVNPKKPRQKKFSQQPRKKLLLACLVTAVIIAGLGLGANRYVSGDPIPKPIKNQLHITLYYPKNMPAQYSVDTSSFTVADGQAMAFNILNSGGETIGVTEQTLPPKLDLSAPDPGGVQPEIFDTPIGKATIRPAGDKRIGYIAAGNTLIIFNLGNTSATDTQAIAKSFHKN